MLRLSESNSMGKFRTFILLSHFKQLCCSKKKSSTNNNNLPIGVILICMTAQLCGKGSKTIHFSILYVTDGARHERSAMWQFVCLRG